MAPRSTTLQCALRASSTCPLHDAQVPWTCLRPLLQEQPCSSAGRASRAAPTAVVEHGVEGNTAPACRRVERRSRRQRGDAVVERRAAALDVTPPESPRRADAAAACPAAGAGMPRRRDGLAKSALLPGAAEACPRRAARRGHGTHQMLLTALALSTWCRDAGLRISTARRPEDPCEHSLKLRALVCDADAGALTLRVSRRTTRPTPITYNLSMTAVADAAEYRKRCTSPWSR